MTDFATVLRTDAGRRVYGLAAMALGCVGLAFADFAAVWQPVPDGLPGRTALAYATALLLLAGGAALQWRRTARWAAPGLAVLYLVFALLWARRIFGHPGMLAVWSGTAEQLAIALGGIVAYAGLILEDRTSRRTVLVARLVFGLCLVTFGLAHFVYLKETADLVPAWLPEPKAWAMATGVGHVLAGLAFLSGIQAKLASRLLTGMFVAFGALVWAPKAIAHPTAHMAWAGNGINLALIGAAWVMADAMTRTGRTPAVTQD